MPRPDPSRINRQAAVIFRDAGETALWRRYISTSAGSPQFGVHATHNYATETITGLFHQGVSRNVMGSEFQQAGGLSLNGQLYISTDYRLDPRDEIIWRGTAYRLDGEGRPQNIGGRIQWESPLKVAGATG